MPLKNKYKLLKNVSLQDSTMSQIHPAYKDQIRSMYNDGRIHEYNEINHAANEIASKIYRAIPFTALLITGNLNKK